MPFFSSPSWKFVSVFTAKIGGSCSASGSMSCGETLDNAYLDSDFVLADGFLCAFLD